MSVSYDLIIIENRARLGDIEPQQHNSFQIQSAYFKKMLLFYYTCDEQWRCSLKKNHHWKITNSI